MARAFIDEIVKGRTKEYIGQSDRNPGESPESIIDVILRRVLKFFGHKVRRNGMARALTEGIVEGDRGRGGRLRRQWKDDLKQWTGGVRENSENWR